MAQTLGGGPENLELIVQRKIRRRWCPQNCLTGKDGSAFRRTKLPAPKPRRVEGKPPMKQGTYVELRKRTAREGAKEQAPVGTDRRGPEQRVWESRGPAGRAWADEVTLCGGCRWQDGAGVGREEAAGAGRALGRGPPQRGGGRPEPLVSSRARASDRGGRLWGGWAGEGRASFPSQVGRVGAAAELGSSEGRPGGLFRPCSLFAPPPGSVFPGPSSWGRDGSAPPPLGGAPPAAEPRGSCPAGVSGWRGCSRPFPPCRADGGRQPLPGPALLGAWDNHTHPPRSPSRLEGPSVGAGGFRLGSLFPKRGSWRCISPPLGGGEGRMLFF